jgi:hypothetical protein
VGSYFYYSGAGTEVTTITTSDEIKTPARESNKNEVTGTVTDIDLSQMPVDGPGVYILTDQEGTEHRILVPSMGITICAAYENISHAWDIALGDTVSVYGDINQNNEIIPCESPSHYIDVTSTWSDQQLGYRFTYTKGPDGYVLIPNEGALGSNFLNGVILFDRAQYAEFQNSSEAREGPPAIHVRVYDNVANQTPLEWAIHNPTESNYPLKTTEPTDTVVGDEEGIQYITDGLWYIDTQIISHDDKIYVLMGAMPDEQNDMQLKYASIRDSFEFIPVTTQ